ncbi:hypothetical protein GH714_004301 [Hevea brasiliensis]|uniref:Uncharacterized protein n=1 Tax=Hevea brasiliensis TaxID=3981 RepID=A0A6A6N8C1_HEVBR|nr:hypothetical protein GH714_004301 [Hevea brasiliensis]
MEAIQVVKKNVAVEDPLLKNSSEEQDAPDETSSRKDKCTKVEQEQYLISDLSSAREFYEEEKDENGDDRKLEFAMGNAKEGKESSTIKRYCDLERTSMGDLKKKKEKFTSTF